jgi:Na+-exporting ATPase
MYKLTDTPDFLHAGMQTELGKIAAALETKEASKETGWRYKWYKTKVALGIEGTTPLQAKYVLLKLLLEASLC